MNLNKVLFSSNRYSRCIVLRRREPVLQSRKPCLTRLPLFSRYSIVPGASEGVKKIWIYPFATFIL